MKDEKKHFENIAFHQENSSKKKRFIKQKRFQGKKRNFTNFPLDGSLSGYTRERTQAMEAATTRRAAPRKVADVCQGDTRGRAAPVRRVREPQSARLTPRHRVGGVVVLQ